MALATVIDIDLRDEKFARFKRMFDAYQEALAKQPKLWAATGDAQAKLSRGTQQLVSGLSAQAGVMSRMTEAGAKQVEQTNDIAKLWTSIAGSTRSVLGNVVSVGESLLKWSGIAGLFTGLLGGGLGIFGFDKLMGGATRDRRSAMGLGMSFGGLRAFDVNLQRLLDPAGFLGWMNSMEQDVTQQRPAFSLLGHALSGNVQSDAVSMLMAARGLAQRTPLQMLGPAFGARGLEFSPEERMRLRTMGGGEFNQLLTGLREDTPAMDVQDRVLKHWQDLDTQLGRAGNQISKVFITGLDPLIPQFTKLSAGFVDAIAAFVRSGEIKKAIDDLADAFKWISGAVAGWKDLRKSLRPWDTLTDPNTPYDPATDTWGTLWGKIKGGIGKWEVGSYLGTLEGKYALPPGLLANIWQRESGGTLNPKDSPAGAMGPFQLMAGTAAALGVKNPHDPFQSAEGSAKLMAQLLQHFDNDIVESLAAYNLKHGQAAEDALLRRWGADWLSHAPLETRRYIGDSAEFLNSLGIKIVVMDATGGSTHVAVNGLSSGSR